MDGVTQRGQDFVGSDILMSEIKSVDTKEFKSIFGYFSK